MKRIKNECWIFETQFNGSKPENLSKVSIWTIRAHENNAMDVFLGFFPIDRKKIWPLSRHDLMAAQQKWIPTNSLTGWPHEGHPIAVSDRSRVWEWGPYGRVGYSINARWISSGGRCEGGWVGAICEPRPHLDKWISTSIKHNGGEGHVFIWLGKKKILPSKKKKGPK